MSIFSFIKSKLSILDVVLEYVQLKKTGSYWKGSCPFHQETDASFTVSPDKQIFYCFGCHAGGDIIAFIAKIENISQIEATQLLIEKYNIEIPQNIQNEFSQTTDNKNNKDLFFHVCNKVEKWSHSQLLSNKNTLKYLKTRNLTLNDINHFKVGYFPSEKHLFNKFLKEMAKQNILLKDLVEIGIIAEGQNNLYSPFEERILFPIKDTLARCCGFGGRIFNPKDQRAKYYNSKESKWFSKGKLLFGLDLAKKEMQKTNNAFLVEGYTDCIAMVKHGYINTVATLGTACTLEHLAIIARYSKTLYVIYDGDLAGQKAILRLTQLCWKANLELKIIKLPEKEDPASFLNQGGKLDGLIKQSNDIFTFFVNSLSEQYWKKTLPEKLELCNKMTQVIANINDYLKQDLLLQKASTIMQIPFQSLKQQVLQHQKKTHQQIQNNKSKEQNNKQSQNNPYESISLIEKKIFAAIINNMESKINLYIPNELLLYFSQPMQELLTKIQEFISKNNSEKASLNKFLDYLNPINKKWIIQCSLKFEQEVSHETFKQLIFRFQKQNWKQIVLNTKQLIFKAKQENDTKKLLKLLNSFSKLKQEMQHRGLI